MSQSRYIIGDTRDVTASLPAGSVDLVLCSPPFLALRSYLPADHPDKGREIGSEPTPAEFLSTLLDLATEWRRVLAPHGSIAIELGDTYSGSGGAGGDYGPDGLRAGQAKFRAGTPRWDGRPEGQVRTTTSDPVAYPARGRHGWPLDKSLCGIPHLFHLSLSYGFNLLNPEHRIEPWRVRNVVAWCRPNPPVGALGDKFRPATSYMTIACVGRQRYFDLDAVRTELQEPDRVQRKLKGSTRADGLGRPHEGIVQNAAGAPPLDWWEISTEPYSGSHYATWPRKLLDRPILAMCPQRVCTVCGKASERIVDHQRTFSDVTASSGRSSVAKQGGALGASYEITRETLGWTDCGHDAWRRGIVLDPFAGSGTTLAVAAAHGRDAIGIDLDERNADLARERCGMFLTVERFIGQAA